jgi:hypothetical protein
MMGLLCLPVVLLGAVLSLAFAPLSGAIILMYLFLFGCDDTALENIAWIFVVTPVVTPCFALVLAVQLCYFPIALLISVGNVILSPLSWLWNPRGLSDACVFFDFEFWFLPMFLFAFLINAMSNSSADDD